MNKLYFKYWGKAENSEDGNHLSYHLLPYHCLDVAAVGHVLFKKQHHLRRKFVELTGFKEDACYYGLMLFLGLHDIGKFSESFQNLRPDLLEKLQNKKSSQSYPVRHDSLGNLLWSDYLWQSFKKNIFAGLPDFAVEADYWQEIFSLIVKAFTGHHGEPPRLTGKNNLHLIVSNYFSNDEKVSAEKFLIDFEKVLIVKVNHPPSAIQIFESMQKTSWLMAGFTVLCDWIGSNSNWFPFCEHPMPIEEYWQTHAIPNAETAILEAGIGLTRPRQTINPFSDMFPKIKKPTPLQRHIIKCPISGNPQLFILEDVTGSGKTEAALVLASRLMAKGQGNGVFIALPTMATSNAMYERVSATYRLFFTEDSSPSLVLAHGARHLSKPFLESISKNNNTQQKYSFEDETAEAQCTSWLADNRKKALLADIGVGTIDQALLAILPSRFQSLRLFGLVGHVLIIDEVHAYDPYMNKLIQTLLSFHAAMGGSAILLSATLPMKVRQEMIKSFALGLEMNTTPKVTSNAYPLVTHLSGNDGCTEIPLEATPQRRTSISVNIIPDEAEVERLIISAAEEGNCVCWIRNTVHDALVAYESLRTKVPADRLLLFHARFAMGDRLDIEASVNSFFGKESGEKDRRSKILVSTGGGTIP